jgi:hypothetical protein
MAKAPQTAAPVAEDERPTSREEETAFVRVMRDMVALDATYRKQGTSLANVIHELGQRTLGLHDGAPAKPSHDPLAKWR